MNKKKIVICTLAALLLGAGSLKAQNKMAPKEMIPHEISISFLCPGTMATPFTGSLVDWSSKPKYAIGFGADYTYWFNPHIGIMAGFKFNYVNNTQEGGEFQADFNGTLTVNGVGFTHADVHAVTTGVSESHTMFLAEAPVRLALSLGGAYLNLGVSIATAITDYGYYAYDQTTYTVSELTDMGVTLPDVPVTLKENLEGETFQTEDARWPFYVLLAGELGYKFRMDMRNAISLSLYGRYALNQNNPDGHNAPYRLHRDNIYVTQPSTTSMVEKIGYYECGLRIVYHYGAGKKKTYF